MIAMGEDEWLDELLREITLKHRVIIDSDDPILISAILNKEIMSQALRRYQGVLDENQRSLAFQLDKQKNLNEEVFTRVVDKLIKSTQELQLNQNSRVIENHVSEKGSVSNLVLLPLVFMIGLVLGIVISKFV